MNKADTYLKMISQADTPESLRDVILSMGFTGLFFQRWYPDMLDIWESLQEEGFLELYHGSQLYKSCPVATAIYTWSRDYTFAQARKELAIHTEDAQKAESLFTRFGGADGVVVLTGTNKIKSAVIMLSNKNTQSIMDEYGDVLSYASKKLASLLPTGHPLLSCSDRQDPTLSETQRKILQMHIDYPGMTNHEVSEVLKISVKTLLAHHKKIAKKIGAPSFTGAIVRHIKG